MNNENDITRQYSDEQIWNMLKPKMEKMDVKYHQGTFTESRDDGGIQYTYGSYMTFNDVMRLVATVYRSGYARGRKGRSFIIGEKKEKGHWEPVDPGNLPKKGTKVRYKGGIRKCNLEKNKKGVLVATETDRFAIRFNDMDWSLWCMNKLFKYFEVWVEE